MRFINSFLYPFVFVCLLWVIMVYQYTSGVSLAGWGVLPRHVNGLEGILTMPLIHANYTHLLSNSLPLIILGAGVNYFYPEVASRVWTIIYVLTGLLVWLFARANDHIGASGVIYGLAAFLLFEGIFRRNIRLMAISLLVTVFYGGIIWGILPLDPHISWEGHLFGAMSGIFAAYIYKKKGPKPKIFDWENEEGPDDGKPHISKYYEVKP